MAKSSDKVKKCFYAGCRRPLGRVLWEEINGWFPSFIELVLALDWDKTNISRQRRFCEIELGRFVNWVTKLDRRYALRALMAEIPTHNEATISGYMEAMSTLRYEGKRYHQRLYPRPIVVGYLFEIGDTTRIKFETAATERREHFVGIFEQMRTDLGSCLDQLDDMPFVVTHSTTQSNCFDDTVKGCIEWWEYFIVVHAAMSGFIDADS